MRLFRCVFSFLFVAELFAQGPWFANSFYSASQQSIPPLCIPQGPRPNQITLRHLENEGIGYSDGYTTLSLFLANREPIRDRSIYFLDLRGHIFNNGKPALNTGIGWRYLGDCQSFGLNTYYDYRNTKRKNYNQYGVGLEYLTNSFEGRINGYFPFGSKQSPLYDLEFSHFSGNSLYLKRKHEFAMPGMDAEVGGHFRLTDNFDLFVGVGPYYFKNRYAKDAVGGKVRLKAQMSPYLGLEIQDSFDRVFKNRFQAELSLSIPFGPKTKLNRNSCCSHDKQVSFLEANYTPPKRQEIVVVNEESKRSLAVNPDTNAPYFFLFVENTSSSNGTYESPFSTLATGLSSASPGDIIYVFPGDGTTTGMDQGADLSPINLEGVRLLGSSTSHDFTTTLGNVTLPHQSSVSPAMANTTGDPIIIPGLNNEISGFILNGNAAAASILASYSGISTSLNINQIQFLVPVNDGVQVSVTNGGHLDLSINQNQFMGVFGNGLNISYTDSTGTIYIKENYYDASIIPSTLDGFHLEFLGTSSGYSEISYNFLQNSDVDGISYTMKDQSNFQHSISNNRIYLRHEAGSGHYGIACRSDDSANHYCLISGNAIWGAPIQTFSSDDRAILLNQGASSTLDALLKVDLINNSFVAGGDHINIYSDLNGEGKIEGLVQLNDFIDGYPSPGVPTNGNISINASGSGPINIDILRNSFDQESQASELNNVSLVSSNGPIDVLIKNNKILNSNASILFMSASSTGHLNVAMIDNCTDQKASIPAATPSVQVEVQNTGFAQLEFLGNNAPAADAGDITGITYNAGDITGITYNAGAVLDLNIYENPGFHEIITNNNAGGTIYLVFPLDDNDTLHVDGNVIYVPREERE